MMGHEVYMARCIELAQLGAGHVAPNPMVGAVLVHNDVIIGEGYHQKWGEPHAEVNCLRSVGVQHRHLLSQATMYVSLEPCAHFGKTPPCADLLIENNIRQVVIGCSDPFNQVNGKGIEKLRAAGINVITGILEPECRQLNKRFFTFHTQQRPYIVLKWAQSNNGMVDSTTGARVLISNNFSNRLVHKWRTEEAGILVGTRTALADDPQLNVRWWTGNNPVRMVIDLDLKLPTHLHLFNNQQSTILFNTKKHSKEGLISYYRIEGKNVLAELMQACYHLKITSLLVEGGPTLHQSLVDAGLWDEARVIENHDLVIDDGVAAASLHHHRLDHSYSLLTDQISFYHRVAPTSFDV